MLHRFCLALILSFFTFTAIATQPVEFDPGLSGFTARVKGIDIAYRQFGLFVMPGEVVHIGVPKAARFQVHANAGTLRAASPQGWNWQAPVQSGHYVIDIVRDDGARLRLETFVKVPATKVRNGKLNGYRIGSYPTRPLNGLASYIPPTGFVEVTPALAGVHVSPHFTLGQFLCKQAGGWPKYLVVQPRLLIKLETVLTWLDTQGIPPAAVHVMSGYRTPWYNAHLRDALYSRHTWGDAADLFIGPVPGDPMPGDVNHDGRDDFKDSKLLAADFSRLFYEPGNDYLRGGIGAYPATHAHLPFVHVDARGFRARW